MLTSPDGRVDYMFFGMHFKETTIKWSRNGTTHWVPLNPGWGMMWTASSYRFPPSARDYMTVLAAVTAIQSGIPLWILHCGRSINSCVGLGIVY